jgi:hypothetical protein
MARTYLVFDDMEGNLDVLRIEYTRCERKGRYLVPKIILQYGRWASMMARKNSSTVTVPSGTRHDCTTAAT